jgi:thymidylate kinase
MKKFFDWIYDLEFKRAGLPSPDLIIFLSLSLENIKKLLLKKAEQQRDYIK